MPRPKLTRIPKTRKVRAPYTREAVEVEQAPQKSPTEIIADEMVEMRKALVAGTANPTFLESIAQAMAVVAEHVASIGDIRAPGVIDVNALATKVDEALAAARSAFNLVSDTETRLLNVIEKQEQRFAARFAQIDKLILGDDPGNAAASDKLLATPMEPAPPNGAEPTKKKRGRPSNAEIAAREAAKTEQKPMTATEVLASMPDPLAPEERRAETQRVLDANEKVRAAQAAPAASLEDEERAIQAFIESKPGVKVSEVMRQFKVSFNRATAYVETWGKAEAPNTVTMDTVAAVHEQEIQNAAAPAPKAVLPPAAQVTVEVPKSTPSLDDIRATAITYAGKHTKEGLGKLLAKYGSDRLSGVPEEQRAALHAELLKGV